MAKTMNELERQIAEKNSQLVTLSHEDNSNGEKIHKLKLELDKLLYSYYKSLKCRTNGLLLL